jgi:hypothetical protein
MNIYNFVPNTDDIPHASFNEFNERLTELQLFIRDLMIKYKVYEKYTTGDSILEKILSINYRIPFNLAFDILTPEDREKFMYLREGSNKFGDRIIFTEHLLNFNFVSRINSHVFRKHVPATDKEIETHGNEFKKMWGTLTKQERELIRRLIGKLIYVVNNAE